MIGYNATGQADNSVVLGNDDVTAVYMGEDSGAKVYAGEGSFTGDVTIGGDVVVSSDARLKSNIVSLGYTLSRLLLIDGKSYEMKGKQKIGVLAQDIQKVFPELVSEDANEMLAVNYQGLVPVLINALKEQDDKISRLEVLVEKLMSDK
ncbi:tail fiber domain-containing protein [Flavobacteriaceae bacterium]|nr:tail fiber domain-containing protein [Flavobacteriaceae bacterium]